MGRLTTHVLDTSRGLPAVGMALSLYRIDGERGRRLATSRTDDDGRCAAPLLDGDAFTADEYEIRFAVGDYLARTGQRNADENDPAFLDTVVIRFGVASPDEHYHVPLLVSPFAYSTYRGS